MLQSAPAAALKRDLLLRPVRIWLYVIAAMVLLMVALGGITRLTHSGLSITSWKPISGVIPPLNIADWQAEFDAYKKIPEYQVQNQWMNLADFQSIYWWEWAHRLLGRIIGLAFFVPFLVFLFQRRLDWKLAPALATLFVLGGFQGFLGWWMVSSGLSERTDVSQYRLAAHLAAASILFAALIWVARSIRPRQVATGLAPGFKLLLAGFAALVFIQLVAGAFVAGLDAGFGYNTWPLIDGAFIPTGLLPLDPWWRNMFENVLTVQFDHRMIAYLIVAYVALLVWRGRDQIGRGPHIWLAVIAVAVLVQVGLGIATLLLVVPLPLAVAHQGMAILLWGSAIAYLADLHREAVV